MCIDGVDIVLGIRSHLENILPLAAYIRLRMTRIILLRLCSSLQLVCRDNKQQLEELLRFHLVYSLLGRGSREGPVLSYDFHVASVGLFDSVVLVHLYTGVYFRLH